MLTGSFSFSRQLQEGIFLSATPTVSSLRPNATQHSGSASFRAIGAVFDQMDEEEDTFAATFRLLGVQTGHLIKLRHPQALLAPSAIPITGLGQIERTINWSPYQTAAAAAAQIIITNDVAAYT
jgi:hypothetical protein